MNRADRCAVEMGVPSLELMENAGRAVADVVARRSPSARVLVLCGPGNNGGDGFVAARILAGRSFRVHLALLGSREHLAGDAAAMAALWAGPVGDARTADLSAADLIVDALFGAGLSRDLDGDARALVERMAACGRPIVAVDLPSGLDGATGLVRGAAAPAVETVTFFRRKPGHLLEPGRGLCGKVRVADIGIPEAALDVVCPRAWANGPQLWEGAFPVPRRSGHKYDRGHAVVVSGGAWTSGAARLAARGALRAGAGLVTVACPAAALPLQAASYAAIMARPMEGPDDLSALLADARLHTVLLGPGLGVGEATRRLAALAAPGRRLVLDADALTAHAGAAGAVADLARLAQALVVTPHDGEFARLFQDEAEVRGAPGKLARTRAAAARLGAVVVLKGPDTVVAAPDGRAAIAENAPPYLATAGAGDVLAGFTLGLLAQGMPAFEAAAAAVWVHGEAARAAGPGLVADDLPEALRIVYTRLYETLGVE
ncbi:NAD(P)H-hydrate dehydratase [Xanthobacter sp. V2C-8]|uniref:NAD(P)H-hydrate dehydratase n=1 Tax=Xanthobacter albus TaxID=3119929 RepID=UPI00372832EC